MWEDAGAGEARGPLHATSWGENLGISGAEAREEQVLPGWMSGALLCLVSHLSRVQASFHTRHHCSPMAPPRSVPFASLREMRCGAQLGLHAHHHGTNGRGWRVAPGRL